MSRGKEETCWPLYKRLWQITDRKQAGDPFALLLLLSARNYPEGALEFARVYDSKDGVYSSAARAAIRRLAVHGNAMAAESLGVDYRNRGDMAGYRHWFAQAAKLGSDDAKDELRAFRTRWPYPVLKRWHRYAGRQQS